MKRKPYSSKELQQIRAVAGEYPRGIKITLRRLLDTIEERDAALAAFVQREVRPHFEIIARGASTEAMIAVTPDIAQAMMLDFMKMAAEQLGALPARVDYGMRIEFDAPVEETIVPKELN
jgi:hypothetical protein